MATSKTLTPTNVTIQIPAFTDKPDQRVNTNCIDKEADAINALSDQIAYYYPLSGSFDTDLLPKASNLVTRYAGNNIQNFSGFPSAIGASQIPFTLETFYVGSGTSYPKQILHAYGETPDTYMRQKYYGGGYVWGAWKKLAFA